MKHAASIGAAALALALAACSGEPAQDNLSEPMSDLDAAQPAANAAAPMPDHILSLAGLGDLHVGDPVPAGSSWTEASAQASDTCRILTSTDYPGAYAIVEEGEVRRISIGPKSDVKLVEGIGTGSSEEQVRQAFPGFRETPHKYVKAPAKYLTAPTASTGSPGLRFEIGQDGKVSEMHVGTMPVLGYVEACS